MGNNRLVYSTESGRICPSCGHPAAKCTCKKKKAVKKQSIHPNDGIVRIRREVKGRKGKTVTAVFGLPLNDKKLQHFAKSEGWRNHYPRRSQRDASERDQKTRIYRKTFWRLSFRKSRRDKPEAGLIANKLFNPGKPISIGAMSIHQRTIFSPKSSPPLKKFATKK